MATQRPVVIQTLWRTCGACLAFMLRERNQVALFYEPLHEDSSKFTRQEWDAFAQQGAGIRVAALRDAGRRRRSRLADLSGRPDAARGGGGETPMFKFCHGFLRQPWLARVLAPATIYLVRRPAGMLKSFRRLNSGTYFVSGFIRILCLNKAEPALTPLYDHLVRLNPEFERLSAQALSGEHLHRLVSQETMQDIVLFFWALGLATHCSMDALILEASDFFEAKTRTARAIGEHIGLDASFHDAIALDRNESEILAFSEPSFTNYTREAIAILAPNANYAALCQELAHQLEVLGANA